MKTIAILGGGTAGTMMANKLSRALDPDAWRIVVVDRDDTHIYQPGLLFVPFGTYRPEEIQRQRKRFLPSTATLILDEVTRIDADGRKVHLTNGDPVQYDILIVATGTRIVPDATPGLLGSHWHKSIFDFYTLDGAANLFRRFDAWDGGTLLLNVAEMPIKCPVAPLEFLFLADAFFTQKGLREKVDIVYATPLDGAFTKPRASAVLGHMLEERNIRVVPDFNVSAVDGDANTLIGYGDIEQRYDLLVTIPQHRGDQAIEESGLGDDLGFLPTDKHTLQAQASPEIFALGDATDLPSSKAGSVAHFQAEVLIENVLRFIDGSEPLPHFDGHANCFIETGYDKAILIDFNYETEPLPGRFPLPGVGPFHLLEESHTNHWGKLGFRWMYWNLLLRGEELPIGSAMSMAGKWKAA